MYSSSVQIQFVLDHVPARRTCFLVCFDSNELDRLAFHYRYLACSKRQMLVTLKLHAGLPLRDRM
jgi:hypothetical protein